MTVNIIALQNMFVDAVHMAVSRPTQKVRVNFKDSESAEAFHDLMLDVVKRIEIGLERKEDLSRLVLPDGRPATQVVKTKSLTGKRGFGKHN